MQPVPNLTHKPTRKQVKHKPPKTFRISRDIWSTVKQTDQSALTDVLLLSRGKGVLLLGRGELLHRQRAGPLEQLLHKHLLSMKRIYGEYLHLFTFINANLSKPWAAYANTSLWRISSINLGLRSISNRGCSKRAFRGLAFHSKQVLFKCFSIYSLLFYHSSKGDLTTRVKTLNNGERTTFLMVYSSPLGCNR